MKNITKKFISVMLAFAVLLMSIPCAFAATARVFEKIRIPIVKNVVSDSSSSVPDKTFAFEFSDFGAEGEYDITNYTVKTEGVGEYTDILEIVVYNESDFWNLSEGFKITEVNDKDDAWEYDNTEWYVTFTLRDDGEIEYTYYNLTEGDEPYETETSYKAVAFTNNYKVAADEEYGYEIRVPFTKTVKQGGKQTPGKCDCVFEIESEYAEENEDFSVSGNEITTNGVGKFDGEIVIEPFSERAYRMLQEGFSVREIEPYDSDEWNADDTVWYVMPDITADGESVVFCTIEEPGVDSEMFDGISFTNVYQKNTISEAKSKEYTLTYDPNGGTVDNPVEKYEENIHVALNKVPYKEGKTFTGWYKDAQITQKIEDVFMTQDTTVYAGWVDTPVPEVLNGDDHIAYVIGYEDGTVRPENNITRAEVSMIFFRLLKSEIREANLTTENVFKDVPENEWYNEAISTMAKIGILKGRTPDSFEPDEPITRAEYAAICARFDKSEVSGNSEFTDIVGHWAEKEINRAVLLGWVKGYSDGTFHPDAEITRAEAMTLTNRVLQRIPENKDELLSGMVTFPDNTEADWYYIAVQEASNTHTYERKENGYEKWTALK